MTCQLCSTPLSRFAVGNFCCHGCQTVHSLLKEEGLVASYQDHPIWKRALEQGWVQGTKVEPKEDAAISKYTFEVEGLWCPFCAEVIQLSLLSQEGIGRCGVDYTTDLATVEFNPMKLSKEKIFQLIKSLGYHPKEFAAKESTPKNSSLFLRFIVASFLAANIMMFSYPLYFEEFYGFGTELRLLSLFFSLPVIFWAAFPLWRKGYHGIKHRLIGMETLVFLGVGSSFIYSLLSLYKGEGEVYFDSMTMVIVFVLLGKLIESKVKWTAKESLFFMHRALPRRGRKRFDNGDKFVSIKEFKPRDRLVVLTGEKIVLDGKIVEGRATIDESLMTGEAIPVEKGAGDRVIGGSVLQSGWLVAQVDGDEKTSSLYHILEAVADPLNAKKREVGPLNSLLKWFVPLIVFLSLMTADFDRGIATLLIACPCAIGIAIPLAESKWIFRLSEQGIVVRNRAVLPLIGKQTLWAFDKTGTLTEGKLTLSSKLPEENLAVLKALAMHSQHPVSQAVYQAISAKAAKLDSVEEVIGKGVKGWVDGKMYLLGSAEFVGYRTCGSEKTTAFFSNPQQVYRLEFEDSLREGAKELVQEIKSVLLSGDQSKVVERVAKELNLKHWKGEMSPEDKREYIQERQREGEIIAMMGDGVNDAPALAQANLSLTPFSATDISRAASDLYLTKPGLSQLKVLSKIGQRGNRIVKQNLFWAFFYNVIGVGLAFFGFLTPLFATSAMVLSSLIVIFNSKRL